MTAVEPRDLTPFTERLGILQVVRVASALAVLGVPAYTGDAPQGLLPLAAVYFGLTLVVEIFRRVRRQRWLTLVSAMLLLDGAFLALATTLTGGARSPLLFVMFLNVLAVTMLASYRSGLKIAIWCAILLFLGQAAARADVLTSAEPSTDQDAALGAAAFLVVALAAAAFSAVNERALRASRSQLASIVDLDAELARTATARSVAIALARASTTRLGFRRVAVVVRHDDGWVHAFSDGMTVDTSASGPPSGAETEGSETGVRLVRTLDPQGSFAALLPDADAVVIAPIEADGEALGIVAAEWADRQIAGRTVEALARAASHSASTLRHHALLAEVARLATHDPLTGLPNRRMFEETFERELDRSLRTQLPLSLLVVDVDHFKVVNDTRGHPAGDATLRAIAAALASSTKGFDLVVRLGGDEFAVVLPECAADSAGIVAERVRAAVAQETAGDTPVTVSVGWAACPTHATNALDLLAAADSGLYAAKRAGRDCARGAERATQAEGSSSDAASSRKRR